MTDKHIKLLFDARVLTNYLHKNSSRSGIFFAALNLLKEFSKIPDLDISLFYEYHMYEDIIKLKKLGIIPENCKIIDLNDLTIPAISPLISFLFKFKTKYPKGAASDNLIKKAIRYFAARLFRLYCKCGLYLLGFKNTAKDYDVFFSPFHVVHPVIKSADHIKSYLLIHDVIPVKLKEFYKGYDSNINTKGIAHIINSINSEDIYFTNSQNTKNDILEYKTGLNPDNFVVAYLGADEKFKPESSEKIERVKAKYNIPNDKKYVFSLCTLEPRKNLNFSIKNFAEFIRKNNIDNMVYVLGGAAWTKYDELDMLDENLFIKTGYIDDSDIAALYSGAEMSVYPSLYEGFGMPVLEAMQCGCPVITSNISSMPEVIGDAGILINPKSNEEMISAYEKMYFDSDFRNQCREKGLERAKQFSWKKCAGIMYEQFCKDLEK